MKLEKMNRLDNVGVGIKHSYHMTKNKVNKPIELTKFVSNEHCFQAGKNGIPKIVIEETTSNEGSTDLMITSDQRSRSNSDPFSEKKKRKKQKKSSRNFFLNLHVPEILRKRLHPEKKEQVIHQGHALVFSTFKKPTFCDLCSKILLDCKGDIESIVIQDVQRQGFKCKKCKKTLHSDCIKYIDHCQGSPIGSFNFSPQNSSADELIFSSVDSVYQVIKEGMDLREKNSVQEMPSVSNPEIYRKKPLTHQLSEPLPKSGLSPTKNNRRTLSSNSSLEFPDDINCYPSSMVSTNVFLRKLSQTPLLKDGEDCESLDSNSSPAKQSIRSNQQQVTLPDFENLYVALHRYDAKQEGDLSLKPGDIIKIIDDKHESWWMGQLENKTGYLPAKFILKLRKKEKIYICVHSTSIKALNDKESTLKKNQIVAVKTDWPVEDDEYFYARTCSMEGYVKKEDLIPL